MDSAFELVAHVMHTSPLVTGGIQAALSAAGIGVVLGAPVDRAGPPGNAVVIADYQSGMSLIAEDRAREPLILFAAEVREAEVCAALKSGVVGYLSLLSSIDELLLCLKTVASGRTYVCQAAAQHVANSIIQPTLTSREEGVLQLLALGFCNKLIAKELGIAVGTTKAHVRAIMSKLDAATRTEAARVAAERGFLNATWNSRGTLPTRRTRDTASGPDAPVISFHMGTYPKGPLRPDRPPPLSRVAAR